MHSNLHEVITTGLARLVASLRVRMISPDQYSSDQGQTLQQVIAHLNQEHGPDAAVYLLAHWVLQVHEVLQAHVTVITPEIALCDLERMQELANLLRLNEEYELLSTLHAQVERAPHTFAPFRAVSGGFATIGEVTTAVLKALGERMAVLGDAALRDRIDDPVALLTVLADRDTMARFLPDASRNRLQQCEILAHMIMIMREFQRLEMPASPMTATADALRLAQLGEVVGIQPRQWVVSTATELPTESQTASQPEDTASVTSEPAPDTSPEPQPDTGLTIDLSQTLPPQESTGVDREAEVAPFAELETGPEPDLLPPVAAGSGLGRMLGMLVLAFAAIALLILFVVRPPWLETWLDAQEAQSGDPVVMSPAATEAPVPTATSIALPTATMTSVPPTATPTPEPTSPAVADIVTANTDLALYVWPHLQAEVMATIGEGEVVIPVQVVTGASQRWLRLEGGHYVLAEAVDNAPRELPAIAVSDLADMPDFSVPATATPIPEPADVEAPPSAEVPPATPVLIVTTRMRAGPGADSPDKGELLAGTSLRLIGTSVDATWFMLDNRYWIPAETVSGVVDGLNVRVPSYALVDANLRAGPTADSQRVAGIKADEVVVLVGQAIGTNPDGIWYQLDTGTWIFSGLVADAPGDLPTVE